MLTSLPIARPTTFVTDGMQMRMVPGFNNVLCGKGLPQERCGDLKQPVKLENRPCGNDVLSLSIDEGFF